MAAGKNFGFTSLVSIYLVVDCNKLSHRMQYIFTCKDQQSHWFFHQLIQRTLPLTLCCVFFILCLSPYRTWNGPMVLRYVFCFALLLVYFIMLTDVLPTGQVTASMECFALPILRNKSNIIPAKPNVRI